MIGCNSKIAGIDGFFRTLDHTLSTSEKTKIQKCPDVGCLVVLVGSQMRNKFAGAYFADSAGIDHLLITSFRIDSIYDRERALFLAYQKKLAGQPVDFFEIKNEMARYDKLEDSIYNAKERKNMEGHMDTARYNFTRFKIGDTLQLQLSLGKDYNHKHVYYYNQYNKDNFKDTLFITGVLLKKSRRADIPQDGYDFTVRIIDVSNRELDWVDKIYRKGNTISVPLYYYGRIINK